MATFRAAEEPHFTFIGRTQLAEPPDGEIVIALGTPDLNGGHGFYALPILLYNGYLVFFAVHRLLHLVSAFDLADIPAFPALKLTRRRHEETLTFRTEHRYTMRDARRLSLVSAQARFFRQEETAGARIFP